jgi:hypothetical protein
VAAAQRLEASPPLAAVAGIALVAGAPATASSGDVVYKGTRVRVAAAAVVNVRALGHEPSEQRSESEPPEPQEKAEPNVRFTVPPPFPAPLAEAPSTSVVESSYVSASFLAQPDAPPVGSTKTESPPDTNGAVGRDKLMVTLNSNYVIQRKSDGKVLSKVSMVTFWSRVGAGNPFDPLVLYDPYSDRWLVSAGDSPAAAGHPDPLRHLRHRRSPGQLAPLRAPVGHQRRDLGGLPDARLQ